MTIVRRLAHGDPRRARGARVRDRRARSRWSSPPRHCCSASQDLRGQGRRAALGRRRQGHHPALIARIGRGGTDTCSSTAARPSAR
jgi:hypothetical protein